MSEQAPSVEPLHGVSLKRPNPEDLFPNIHNPTSSPDLGTEDAPIKTSARTPNAVEVPSPMGHILAAAQVFAQETVKIYAGSSRTKFVVHKHLLSPTLLSTSALDNAAEISLPDEDEDSIGMMVYWSYNKRLPSIPPAMKVKLMVDKIYRNPQRPIDPRCEHMVAIPWDNGMSDQFQTLEVYCRQKQLSFEEFRLEAYDSALSKGIIVPQSDNDWRRIRQQMEDVDKIPVTGSDKVRVAMEILQLKLIKLAIMAARKGWSDLLAASLGAYCEGEIGMSRRCPLLRHIGLVYSQDPQLPQLRKLMVAYAVTITQQFATRGLLLEDDFCVKHPDFLKDFMDMLDAGMKIGNPLEEYIV